MGTDGIMFQMKGIAYAKVRKQERMTLICPGYFISAEGIPGSFTASICSRFPYYLHLTVECTEALRGDIKEWPQPPVWEMAELGFERCLSWVQGLGSWPFLKH